MSLIVLGCSQLTEMGNLRRGRRKKQGAKEKRREEEEGDCRQKKEDSIAEKEGKKVRSTAFWDDPLDAITRFLLHLPSNGVSAATPRTRQNEYGKQGILRKILSLARHDFLVYSHAHFSEMCINLYVAVYSIYKGMMELNMDIDQSAINQPLLCMPRHAANH